MYHTRTDGELHSYIIFFKYFLNLLFLYFKLYVFLISVD